MMLMLLSWIALAVCVGGDYQDSSQENPLHNKYIQDEAFEDCYEDEPQGWISEEELEKYFEQHKGVGAKRQILDGKLAEIGKVEDGDTDISMLRSKMTDPHFHMHERMQLVFEAVSEDLIRKYNLSNKDVHEKLSQHPLRGAHSERAKNLCTQRISVEQCDPSSPYRRADGTCNNLQNPDWGSSGVCFRRFLPSSCRGQSGFRKSVLGGPLPPPRRLSLNVHNNLNRPTNDVSHMYMYFGQLLDHDITHTAISTTANNEAIQCCPPSKKNHPQCAPIRIPPDDPFYSEKNKTCMNFVRSAACPTCALGHRQQMNQKTAFIDGSVFYGNSEKETRGLRTLDGTGRLRCDNSRYGELLPSDPSHDSCPGENNTPFQSGDSRANQHPPLACLQTIGMREHNRIADELHKMNPSWDDEKIFQESRRIVGAEMQVITYKEYLPITLGDDKMTFFNLWLSEEGTTVYNDELNPSLWNEFSGAAFRFGHSHINSLVASWPLNEKNGPRWLKDEFFQISGVRTGLCDSLMNGVANSPAQCFDRHLVPDVTNYLYRKKGKPAGLDLAAINIQRGRDHGLPRYVDMVHFCNDNSFEITCFEDLSYSNVMTTENMQLLMRNYRDVNDIDLWTGILSEIPLDGAMIGPTGACIIGRTFHELKHGDRFYFEHGDQSGSFTNEQIQELRKCSLSNLICLNTATKRMQMNAMLSASPNNPWMDCDCVQGPNLTYWKE